MAGPRILLGFLFMAAAAAASAASAPPAAGSSTLSADLDGDGSVETVTAKLARRGVDFEVRSAGGKKIAGAVAPAPRERASLTISLTAGPLGSTGALLEVGASSPGEECRSVWRLGRGRLSRVPVSIGASTLPDCAGAGEWTSSWDRPSEKEPALYRRERTRETAEGTHHVVESFRYDGTRLEPDPAHSAAEIRGVQIPRWFAARLYPKDFLTHLYGRFDLSNLKKAPKLVWRTDPAEGVFSLEVDRPAGRETFPVLRVEKGEMHNELLVRVGVRDSPRQVRVTLGGNSSAPSETVLSGFDPALDGTYTPVMRLSEGKLVIYGSASEEIGLFLVGTWTGAKGEQMEMSVASGTPFLLQIGKYRCRIEIDSAPDGVDVVAFPTDGAAPFGLLLRGPSALDRFAMKCGPPSPASSPPDCRTDGPGERFHLVGARLNAR